MYFLHMVKYYEKDTKSCHAYSSFGELSYHTLSKACVKGCLGEKPISVASSRRQNCVLLTSTLALLCFLFTL